MLLLKRDRALFLWVRPAIVRDNGGPAGPPRVLIIWVAAEPLVKLAVFAHLFAIQLHSQAAPARYADRPALIFHQATFNDVVRQVVVMCIRCEGQVWQHGAEMQHGRELNSQFAGGVHGDAKLEGFANTRRLYARPDAAPEGGVQQYHVNGGIQIVGGELFKIDDHGISRQRDSDHLARAAHAVEAEHRVLEVVVAEVLNRLSEANRLFFRPDRIGVEAERISGQRVSQRAVDGQLVVGTEDAAFELVGA